MNELIKNVFAKTNSTYKIYLLTDDFRRHTVPKKNYSIVRLILYLTKRQRIFQKHKK